MVRKGTALILLLLMMVVVATSQPGLSYCLCFQKVFLSGCPCQDLVEEEACSHTCDGDLCDCSSQDAAEINQVNLSPCQDCPLSLQLEIGDFVGADSSQNTPHAGGHLTPPGQFGELEVAISLKDSIHGIRGSPPPDAGEIPPISLRVRYSVFLV